MVKVALTIATFFLASAAASNPFLEEARRLLKPFGPPNVLRRENPLFVKPDHPALQFIGRFNGTIDIEGHPVSHFDMNGCEVRFRVEGASEVTLYLEQTLSGPRGWYRKHPHQHVMTRKSLRLATELQQMQPALGLSALQTEEDEEGDIQEYLGLDGGEISALGMEVTGSQPQEFLVFIDGEPILEPIDGSECRACTFDTRNAELGQVLEYRVASGLAPGSHEIRIFKTSEPEWSSPKPVPNFLTLHGLKLDGGRVMEPATPRPERRVEFQGDSVSSGYCNLCRDNKEYAKRQGSYAAAWPSIACSALGAECHHLAMAGYGVACNCCSEECAADTLLPRIWERSVATDANSVWDAKSWVPHAVVMNLGDNDHVWNPARDKDAYVAAYLAHLENMGKSYGPETHYFLGCGPRGFRLNQDDALCELVQRVVGQANDKGLRTHFLDQRGYMDGQHGKPCCGHPSVPIGQAMARDAAIFVASEMGW